MAHPGRLARRRARHLERLDAVPAGHPGADRGYPVLAGGLGSLTGSDVWTAYTFFRLGFELVFLACQPFCSVWLVAAAARGFGRSTTTIAALTMALSFGIVYYGAATVYVTDLLPVAAELAAHAGSFGSRFVLAGSRSGWARR